MKFVTMLVIAYGLAFGQSAPPAPPAPNYFGGAFAGFDSAATPKASGGVFGGKLMNAPDSTVPLYSTLEVSPTSVGTSTVVAGVWARVWSNDKFFVALQGAAGAATSAQAAGLALQTGGAFGYRPFKSKPISIIFKPAAIKVNVGGADTPGRVDFAPQFKFGIMWAFK